MSDRGYARVGRNSKIAFVCLCVGAFLASLVPAAAQLPSGFSNGDIGSVGVAGSATFANNVFTLKGSGTGVSGTADEFQFVYQPLSGDGTIVARVVSLTGGEAGVMIRETLTPGSTVADVDCPSSTFFRYRLTTGGSLGTAGGSGKWVKLVRSGSTFTAYTSLDGMNWTQIGTAQTISMATNVYIGLFASSLNNSSLATATIDNVSINSAASPAPVITGLSATTGTIGSQVVISGSGFGASQAGSLALLNGAGLTVNSWSATSITVTIPAGTTSGLLVVSVASSMNDSNPVNFAVTSQPLPTSWLDQDIGAVGVGGSATFTNGTFTANGSGTGVSGSADKFHFVYQPLSGDGTIVARVVSLTSGAEAGVMIRETLTPGSTVADVDCPSSTFFRYRLTTGGSIATAAGSGKWVKVVRSGSTFSGYASLDGMNWTQIGTAQTISMATNVYIGLFVSSLNNSSLATATFDSVSINSVASPPPSVTSVSPGVGIIGSETTISGSGFGASQGSSLAVLNGVPLTVDFWSDTSITVTVPAGTISGPLVVLVAPTMNSSNPVTFLVAAQPLAGWMDVDVGSTGMSGSAIYSNGAFRVNGSGAGISGTADAFNYVFQPLSGDGTIVARVVSLTAGEAGAMIRESVNANSTMADTDCLNSQFYFRFRLTTGANAGSTVTAGQIPYWVKVVRSGSTFSGYTSLDGVNWTQLGTNQTISMATNVYIGLLVSSANNLTSAAGIFDNVSVSSPANPPPVISSVTPDSGPPGASVAISGSNFGTAKGASSVQFNGVVAATSNWSNTSISATVPTPAETGPVVVVVNGQTSNGVQFTAINTGTLSGTVTVASSGAAVAGAQIQLKQAGQIKSTTSSDVNGNYAFSNLTSGSYDVVVTSSGYGTSVNSPVSVPADTTTILNISLSAPGSVSGTVTKQDGITPISGVTVQALVGEASAGSATTDANGNYTISGLDAGNYNVQAFASGYSSSSESESVVANTTVTANFSLQTQGAGAIQYVYDALGRLVAVINPNGDTAQYNYDAVGNLQSISRWNSSQLSIITITPPTSSAGTTVTIYGTGFSSTPSQNTVSFNGTAATVQSATPTQLIVTVPSGAVSGPVTVTTPSSTAMSSASFTVINK